METLQATLRKSLMKKWETDQQKERNFQQEEFGEPEAHQLQVLCMKLQARHTKLKKHQRQQLQPMTANLSIQLTKKHRNSWSRWKSLVSKWKLIWKAWSHQKRQQVNKWPDSWTTWTSNCKGWQIWQRGMMMKLMTCEACPISHTS